MLLQIRHIGMSKDVKQLFVVMRDSKQIKKPVPITSPWEIMIGTQTLQQGLRWYLEKYLELPIDNFRTQAETIQAALSQWKQDCLGALFAEWKAQGWYHDARKVKFTNLRIQVVSNDATVLSWPWEVLENWDDDLPGRQCQIERCIEDIGDVSPLPERLTAEQLNILYIIARPYGNRDVGFQTLARPLIDFTNKGGWPVHIDVLRPPTFDQLCATLEENPGFYHIVHFDGHGGYMDSRGNRAKDIVPSGKLIFEKDDSSHSAHEIPGSMLAELLREHNVPVIVLNACQSAMHATDPFASVAVSLLNTGIRRVVAMSYNLWVSGAKVFIPAFYLKLFQKGNLAEAIQAGRREMFNNQMRDTFFGQVPFHDWMVPVLYQQSAEDVLPKLEAGEKHKSTLPTEAQYLGDYGFIGRDRAIKNLERATILEPAGILIHGMAGEGKTTLAKGFLHWLEATHGLGNGVFWFSFEDIHSAEYIINTLAETLLGTQAMALPAEQKLTTLTKALRENRSFIVWDNFESASGIPGTEVYPLLPEEDRVLLKEFLYGLHGGQSKVLITSRSPAGWLTSQECCRLPLEGLKGEELWQYCNAVVADLGLSIDRESEIYKKLMDKLEGNPLAVRVILLQLREKPMEALLAELEEDFHSLESDKGMQRIQAALSVFERGLDRTFTPILRLIGLHEHFMDVKLLEQMLKDGKEITVPLKNCMTALESAGICHNIGNDIYQIHPSIRGCLTRLHPAEEHEEKTFVEIISVLASVYAKKKLHEQRIVFSLHGANFHHALRLAWAKYMPGYYLELIQALAAYALNTRNFMEAERLNIQCIEMTKEYGGGYHTAIVYYQLGGIARELWNFEVAEEWYKKSLAIKLKLGDKNGAAEICYYLGVIAEEQWHFDAAVGWYMEALVIKLKLDDEFGAATIFYNLGEITKDSRYPVYYEGVSEDWYKMVLAIIQKLSDKYIATIICNNLGQIVKEQRYFEASEELYKKALITKLKLDDEYGTAVLFKNLGGVAGNRCDFVAAEDWYKKALKIELEQGNEYAAASTFSLLGDAAIKRRDFETAEEWCKKALNIYLKFNDEYSAALIYLYLGKVAQWKQDPGGAADWLEKSLAIHNKALGALPTPSFGSVQRCLEVKSREKWRFFAGIFPAKNTTYAISAKIDYKRESLEFSLSNLFELAAEFTLTKTEAKIYRMLVKGLSNRKIAEQLFIDERVVKKIITYICKKMDIRNRAQFVDDLAGFDIGFIDYPFDEFEFESLDDLAEEVFSRKLVLDNTFDLSLDETFSAVLLRLIDATGNEREVCRRAKIDRRLLTKIRCNSDYIPTKRIVLAFAIALELNIDQTTDLLKRAGFVLTPSYKFDVIVEHFIKSRKYDIDMINEVLLSYKQPIFGILSETSVFKRAGSDDLATLNLTTTNHDESFFAAFMHLFNTEGKKDLEVLRLANIDRRLFRRIRYNPDYVPNKYTVLAFAIALKLNIDQTADLLNRAGYVMSSSRKFDVIVEHFINNRNYDISEINKVLSSYDQQLLGVR